MAAGRAACYLRPERISWLAYFFDLESSFLMDRCTRLAQFNTDTLPSEGAAVQLLCEDHIGTYTLPFLCLRSENGWVDAETSSPIDAGVLGWREPPVTPTARQPVWAHRLSMLRTFRSRTPGSAASSARWMPPYNSDLTSHLLKNSNRPTLLTEPNASDARLDFGLEVLATRKETFLLGLIFMLSPVAGLRPIRAARF